MIKFLDLKKQYIYLKKDIDKKIFEIINQSSFIGGPYIKKFEKNFSNYNKIDNCIGVANGTDALEISIEALNIKKGKEIIVPSNSWISSAEAVTRNNLNVVFVDINYDNFTINIDDLNKKITKNTSAIMVVHLFGHPCNMQAISKIAKKNKLKIIEDCAQSHGSMILNRKVGTFGDIASFSFYPGKNLGAYGDAGVILTKNNNLAKKCRRIANHGGLKKHEHKLIGRNSRLDSMQSAIINVKLKHLDNFNKKRNFLAKIYFNELKNNKFVVLPKNSKNIFHSYHLFVVKVQKRKKLIEYLKDNNIQTSIHYPKLLPRLHPYKKLNKKNFFPISEKLSKEILSLPLHEMLEKKEILMVCKKINKFYGL